MAPSPVHDAAHIAACALAAMRLTDLVLFDRIAEPLRRRVPGYLLRCPRCLSVWMGAAAVIAYWACPWANWPLALSWLYLRMTR